METNRVRLSPLLSVAAVSVIVLSAVGVATLTGLIPSSRGQASDAQLPPEIAKPIAPAISHPVAKPAARKAVARKTTQSEVTESPRIAEAPAAPVPAMVGQLAVVESVREVKEPGEAKGVGAVAGGVAGAVLGNKLGKGKGLATLLGAAGGAFAGHQIERQVRADSRWEISIRLDDGTQRNLSSDTQPAWHADDRVRLVNDQLRPI